MKITGLEPAFQTVLESPPLNGWFEQTLEVPHPSRKHESSSHSFISGGPLLGGCFYLSFFAGLPTNGSVHPFMPS